MKRTRLFSRLFRVGFLLGLGVMVGRSTAADFEAALRGLGLNAVAGAVNLQGEPIYDCGFNAWNFLPSD